MKMKNFRKYVLSGLLLTSAPFCVFAQQSDVTVPEKITSQQLTTVSSPNDTAAGVEIKITGVDAGNVLYKAENTAQNKPFVAGAGTIQLNGVDVAKATNFDNWVASTGVLINNSAKTPLSNKTINTGNINIAGEVSNGYLVGFAYHSDYDYVTGKDQAFDGTLTIGDVNVKNTDAYATGLEFDTAITGKVTVGNIKVTADNSAGGFDADSDLTNGATVTLGNVDVEVNSEDASGVYVDSIGDSDKTTAEKFTIGNINVTSKDGYGYGVVVGNIQEDGVFEAKDITVKSTNSAYGVTVDNIAADSTFDVGKIQVESNADAYGIYIYNNATFTITNDVIAKTNAAENTYANAFGIVTQGWGWYNDNSNLTIDTKDGDVQISGIATNPIGNTQASIYLTGNNDTLTIKGANKHTNKNQEFIVTDVENVNWETDADYSHSDFITTKNTAHKVATGKTVVLNGVIDTNGRAYTVGSAVDNKSAGTLVVNQLAADDVTVNNGLLALDGSANSVIDTLTIGNANPDAQAPAAVALYGNILAGNVGLTFTGEPAILSNAVVDPTTDEHVLSLSTITEYKLNPAKTAYVAQNRERASLADGFLLPALVHRYNTGWEATRDHLISGGQRVKAVKGILGQAPCDPCESVCAAECDPCEEVACNPCEPCGSQGGGLSVGRSAWVNYIGRSNSYRSSYSNIGIDNGDWDIGTDGVQVGLDLYKTSKTQFGLLFGYEGSKAVLHSDCLEADDVYFGVYGARVFQNGTDFRVVYNYGSQNYKLLRFDPGLGFDWHSHHSAFDGNTHEVNLELGKRIFANRRWSYRPVIGFDLLVNDWEAALEDGNLSTAIAYSGADYTQAFLRIGSDLQFAKGGFMFNSGLYYSYDLNNDVLKSKVFARDDSALGYNKNIDSMLYGSELGGSVLTFNVGSSVALGGKTSVFGGFTGNAILDRDGDGFQSNGYVGLQYQW
ncbi:MAG: autotransporter domain-containing protein [Planctomycetaceae bacterium]|nr:autotransporter domain-containing protein [Planctomycetaceae bacterium]